MNTQRRAGSTGCRRILALCATLVLANPASAWRLPNQLDGASHPNPVVANGASVHVRRALVVFARFNDDTSEMQGCTEKATQWHKPDDLPAFSDYLLAIDPTPPFDPRSLTDYFHQQSNGQLIFFGEVYPEVVVAPGRQADYGVNGVNPHFLTPDILEIVNRDERIDLSEFDHNNDGYLDYVLIVLRSRERWVPSIANASGIGYLGYHSSEPEFGNKEPLKRAKNQWGGYVIYDNPGNIFPDLNLVRLMAHEIGHSLWGWGHPKPIGGPDGVPSNDSRALGYLLMAGPGNRAGSLTISAAERDLLNRGWITCPTLSRDTTIEVTDLYSTSQTNCYKVETIDVSGASADLYIENRQRVSHFDRLRSESCYGSRSDHGLMSTGLMLTKVDHKARMAILAADNSLDISVRHEDYAGDMFTPSTRAQITPWSNPNIHGWSAYPPGFHLGPGDFIAVDNITYGVHERSALMFDYVTDFRNQPIFRSNSTIGLESRSVTLFGPAQLQSGSTLQIATDVTVNGRLVIDAGSVLHVESGASFTVDTLWLERGAIAKVDGLMTVRNAVIDRGGDLDVDSLRNGFLTPARTEFDAETCRLRTCVVDLEAYPNPVRELLSIVVFVPTRGAVSLKIYDSLGRIIEEPVRNAILSSGRHTIRWRPRNVAAGTYIVKLTAGRIDKAVAIAVVQ